MIVQPVTQLTDLQPYQKWWNEQAGGCPFRSYTWLTTWWKHYGERRQLQILLVLDNSDPHQVKPIGILPGYIETTRTRGKVLRLLGDGEVCSEHLDLLIAPKHEDEACYHLAQYLVNNASEWDSMNIAALAEKDRVIRRLIEELSSQGCAVHRSASVNLWSIPLPNSWDEFLTMQSKSHRKQLRQLKNRVLSSPRARWLSVADVAQFEVAWEHLTDLHQRRRQSLGEPGCFASPLWANFHREVALQFLEEGQLGLSILELDGRPIAAEYHLAGRDATYAYQGGIDPDRRDEEPGQLSLILCVERAIAEGHKRFELLRGDEAYKPHWRAVPTPTVEVAVISPRARARWRHCSWNGARQAVRLVRQLTNLLG